LETQTEIFSPHFLTAAVHSGTTGEKDNEKYYGGGR